MLRIFQANQNLYEDVVAALILNCPGGGVFVDCGAHLGDHTIKMLNRSDVERVLAIEAIPSLTTRLRQRFNNEDRLRIYQYAIGSDVIQTEFNVASNAMGYSGILQRDITGVANWEKITVEMTTLDRIMMGESSNGYVRFIKLDLEGGEYNAILGAMNTISSGKPFIVFENGLAKSADLYGYGWQEFSTLFDVLGYVVYDFFGNEVTKEYWNAPLLTYMFVAVPIGSALAEWYGKNCYDIVSSVSKSLP